MWCWCMRADARPRGFTSAVEGRSLAEGKERVPDQATPRSQLASAGLHHRPAGARRFASCPCSRPSRQRRRRPRPAPTALPERSRGQDRTYTEALRKPQALHTDAQQDTRRTYPSLPRTARSPPTSRTHSSKNASVRRSPANARSKRQRRNRSTRRAGSRRASFGTTADRSLRRGPVTHRTPQDSQAGIDAHSCAPAPPSRPAISPGHLVRSSPLGLLPLSAPGDRVQHRARRGNREDADLGAALLQMQPRLAWIWVSGSARAL